MRVPRLYYAGHLETGLAIQLEDNTAHYIMRVLRLRVGSSLILFNGTGNEYNGSITEINKRQLIVMLHEEKHRDCESPLQIHLGQAISRAEKMDFTIQKAVELGVHKITPILTERCGVKLTHERIDKRLQHWQSIIISACEQSGRNHIPMLSPPISLPGWLAQHSIEDISLVLHPHTSKNLHELSFEKTPNKIRLLIGAEGGFSENEVNLAIAQHFQAIRLGPRILRTETAAMAALTALQCYWGDL